MALGSGLMWLNTECFGTWICYKSVLSTPSWFNLTVPSDLFVQNYYLHSGLFCHFACAMTLASMFTISNSPKAKPARVSLVASS